MSLPHDIPSPFVLLDSLEDVSKESLAATMGFHDAPSWQCLEAAAQAAALHQRICNDFADHAFLLSVKSFPVPQRHLKGVWTITAQCLGQSSRAAIYEVILTERTSGRSLAPINLTIGHVPYGGDFDADRLSSHYRSLFQCLRSRSL